MTLQNQLEYMPTLLDGVDVVPDGIDSNILKSEIMLTAGLRIPLYSEPSVMKAAITQWFAARSWTFEHLLNIINAEYSPIENTDRYDTWTREIERALDRTDTGRRTGTDTRANTGTDTRANTGTNRRNTESSIDTSNEDVTTVAAFNSSGWDNSQKETRTGSTDGTEDVTETLNTTQTDTHNTTQTDTHNTTDTNMADEDEDTTETYNQHLHGNIGVTTNQEMINQELDLLARFNIYGWIAKQFAADLTLDIW